MFVGRKRELDELEQLSRLKKASLIVLRGRRRVGKSSLLQEFARKKHKLIEISGLAPVDGVDNESQLQNFSEQLSIAAGIPGFSFSNWTEAFAALGQVIKNEKVFILIDEISWMASSDKTFLGKLKIAWDKDLSKNPKLMLALCGSVSSWINKNILENTDFVGRISWEKNLKEITIDEAAKFWKGKSVSTSEKLKFLSIVGGIPKYLEEMIPTMSAEENIERLAFSSAGYLFNDFKKIFTDIFNTRSSIYLEILAVLVDKKLQLKEIAAITNLEQNGDLTEYINDMEQAGFIARDYNWSLSGKVGKLSKIRIKDNYLRFYLKYIRPNEDKIKKDIFHFNKLESLLNWDTICGFQFENLVHNNIDLILKEVGVSKRVLQYGPIFQRQSKTKQGCQIDLMILTDRQAIYLCELKFRKKIGKSVIKEVSEKIEKMKFPRSFSVRPVLIYSGELSEDLVDEDYFEHLINFDQFLD